MSNKCSVTWCYLPKYQFNFGLEEAFVEAPPALNIALCALSQILTNNHLMMNILTEISESVRNRIKNTFTQTNLPSTVFQDEELLIAPVSCAIYGSYLGREKETDTEIIYINRQLIEYSKMNNHPTDVIRYGAVLRFSILRELGHWSFHHFACNMDHDLETPKGVLMEEAGDAIEFLLFGFRIQHYGPEHPKLMIDEIVTKFNRSYRIIPLDYLKSLFEENTYAIFNPINEPTLQLTTNHTYIPTGKRIFDPHDKNY
ncbi:hypothetical protein I4U23_022662 [Adineta vaga]|nr:hypothetical protein I4U23_022662 [Adineta vaga]